MEVWVNNAGLLRTVKAWEHPDEEVRLLVEVNVLGVMYGSRAAVEVMRNRGGQNRHIINIASLSALSPVPGLAVYAATKHAVVGFTGSLQGDLDVAGLPITVHAVCPDAADTQMVRERVRDELGHDLLRTRLLSAEEVADRTVALLDSKAHRRDPALAWLGGPPGAMAGRHALRATGMLRKQGELTARAVGLPNDPGGETWPTRPAIPSPLPRR